MHLDKVIAQRRFVSSFVKQYAALHAPQETQPQEIIPDTIDDVPADEDAREKSQGQKKCLTQIQAEDFCNFVIADISQGRNNVYMSGAKEKMRMHSVVYDFSTTS
ncbi:hypothetical protein L916_19846 [Phytophthora nicotianae]|uniref:Uncharacterized protein n=1 Tax=Phytophthora nicotianae TaxID=4792 RepID=W2HX27_PHYNI|nr:hypothetical protein L916_19846 [Phytophthora nicotianae]